MELNNPSYTWYYKIIFDEDLLAFDNEKLKDRKVILVPLHLSVIDSYTTEPKVQMFPKDNQYVKCLSQVAIHLLLSFNQK